MNKWRKEGGGGGGCGVNNQCCSYQRGNAYGVSLYRRNLITLKWRVALANNVALEERVGAKRAAPRTHGITMCGQQT